MKTVSAAPPVARSNAFASPPVRAEPRTGRPQVVSIRGARTSQEDRFLILSVQRKNHPIVPENGWLMAVMDGHGGPEASQAVEAKLPGAFQRAFKECHGDYKKTLTRAVELLNEEPQIKYQISAGTTLSMVYAANNLAHIYVAHLGDSPVILFDSGGHILFRTEEHNIITNPRELDRARSLSVKRHGADRIHATEIASRSGRVHAHYLKDRRMDDDFEAMSGEILDTIEKLRTADGAEYSMHRMMEDGNELTRVMRGKGIQNTAQLGAYPFDAVLSREPDVAEVLVDPNRLPVYILLATDGILDIHPGAPLPELEKEIAHAIAVEGVPLADLVNRAGGDNAHDNTTAILYRIS